MRRERGPSQGTLFHGAGIRAIDGTSADRTYEDAAGPPVPVKTYENATDPPVPVKAYEDATDPPVPVKAYENAAGLPVLANQRTGRPAGRAWSGRPDAVPPGQDRAAPRAVGSGAGWRTAMSARAPG
ncbi:hypothetical protein GCM10017600_48160 [Streptosporangium carneum]|uniref:Uncharacterized protein n=1 Tax=Streptosporangium carneum TaxID=47481 RepID=A0A9W6MEB9_9ACTN|nr:hypothetical protein GCM10017600_48160 [Streptosporangium carneum]